MNKLKPALLGVMFSLLAITSANAQVTLDVSKITCEQFLLFKVVNPDKIVLWLSGFINGKRVNTIIEVQQFEEDSRKLTDHCRGNFSMPIMQAAEGIIAAKR